MGGSNLFQIHRGRQTAAMVSGFRGSAESVGVQVARSAAPVCADVACQAAGQATVHRESPSNGSPAACQPSCPVDSARSSLF